MICNLPACLRSLGGASRWVRQRASVCLEEIPGLPAGESFARSYPCPSTDPESSCLPRLTDLHLRFHTQFRTRNRLSRPPRPLGEQVFPAENLTRRFRSPASCLSTNFVQLRASYHALDVSAVVRSVRRLGWRHRGGYAPDGASCSLDPSAFLLYETHPGTVPGPSWATQDLPILPCFDGWCSWRTL